jgi:plastocyanin
MLRSRLAHGAGAAFLVLALAACSNPAADNTVSNNTTPGGGGSPSGVQAQVKINVAADPTTVGKFDPTPASAKVGDTVEWIWVDDASSHTVTADDSSFDSGTLAKGQTFTHKFTSPGTFKYHCSLHASMLGSITVS